MSKALKPLCSKSLTWIMTKGFLRVTFSRLWCGPQGSLSIQNHQTMKRRKTHNFMKKGPSKCLTQELVKQISFSKYFQMISSESQRTSTWNEEFGVEKTMIKTSWNWLSKSCIRLSSRLYQIQILYKTHMIKILSPACKRAKRASKVRFQSLMDQTFNSLLSLIKCKQ